LKERGKNKLQNLGNKLNLGKVKTPQKSKKGVNLKDNEVGKTVNFSAKGTGHRLWINTQGTKTTVIVASVPTPVEAKLVDWENRRKVLPEEKQAKVLSLIAAARQKLGTTNQLAEKAVQQIEKAKQLQTPEFVKQAEQSDKQTEVAEVTLAEVLAHLFELFGEENTLNPAVIQTYKQRIQHLQKDAGTILGRFEKHKDEIQEKVWSTWNEQLREFLKNTSILSKELEELRLNHPSTESLSKLEKKIQECEKDLEIYKQFANEEIGASEFTSTEKNQALHQALAKVANQFFPVDDVKTGEPSKESAADQEANEGLKNIATTILTLQSKYEAAANGKNGGTFEFQGTEFYVCRRSKYIIPQRAWILINKNIKIAADEKEKYAEKAAGKHSYGNFTVGELNNQARRILSSAIGNNSGVKIGDDNKVILSLAVLGAEPIRNNLANFLNIAIIGGLTATSSDKSVNEVHPMARGGGMNETAGREVGGKVDEGTWELEIARAKEIIQAAELHNDLKLRIRQAKNVNELAQAYEVALKEAILRHEFHWAMGNK
jgi:hypothetical protein